MFLTRSRDAMDEWELCSQHFHVKFYTPHPCICTTKNVLRELITHHAVCNFSVLVAKERKMLEREEKNNWERRKQFKYIRFVALKCVLTVCDGSTTCAAPGYIYTSNASLNLPTSDAQVLFLFFLGKKNLVPAVDILFRVLFPRALYCIRHTLLYCTLCHFLIVFPERKWVFVAVTRSTEGNSKLNSNELCSLQTILIVSYFHESVGYPVPPVE